MSKPYPINQEGADNATRDISNIMLEAGGVVPKKPMKPNRKKAKNKPGYDHECYTLKRNLSQLSNLLHKFPSDPFLRATFIKRKKEYRTLVKHKNKKYKEEIIKDIERLESTNPKEYWNLIHKLRDMENKTQNKKVEPNIGDLMG